MVRKTLHSQQRSPHSQQWKQSDKHLLLQVSPPRQAGVWQGQAFETMEGSVNSLPDIVTPCLKIRHMYDREKYV